MVHVEVYAIWLLVSYVTVVQLLSPVPSPRAPWGPPDGRTMPRVVVKKTERLWTSQDSRNRLDLEP